LIQITEDGGGNWREVEAGSLPGVPKTAFVNDIKADLYDANTVYIALDNHKYGDLNPYLLKSTNRGKNWRSIAGNLPERTLVWRVVQDHVKPELLFAGTEFGVYFTIDGGKRWMKLKGGVPTISFRDLAIQRRENDLVGATFGRGFYVFDDYSVLRHISGQQLEAEATLFPIRKAWWYIQRPVLGFSEKASQGAAFYTAPNPPFGAVFTYYLSEGFNTKKDVRQEKEKDLVEKDKDVPFSGWDEMEAERRQEDPVIWLTVEDRDGNTVRRVKGPAEKGFHRVAWDLKYPAHNAIDYRGTLDEKDRGSMLSAPGEYSVTLSKQIDGVVTVLAGPVAFEVERLRKGALERADDEAVVAFWERIGALQRATSATSLIVSNSLKKVDAMRLALSRTPAAPGNLDKQLHDLREVLLDFDEQLNGNRAKRQVGEKNPPTIRGRLGFAAGGTRNSTYGPTPNLKNTLDIADSEFRVLIAKLELIFNELLPEMEKALMHAGAPWVEGQPFPAN